MAITNEQAIATLQDDSLPEGVRETAVHHLQHNPTDDGIAALVVALRDRDSGVRYASSSALASLGERALNPLLRAISSTDNDSMLRAGAHRVLSHSVSLKVRQETAALRKALVGPGAQPASMEEAARLLFRH